MSLVCHLHWYMTWPFFPATVYLFAATEVAPMYYIPETDTWYDLSGLDAPYQTYWAVEYVGRDQNGTFRHL